MLDVRLRNKITDDELAQKVGKLLTPEDINVLLTGAARVSRPDGTPLLVYLPAALAPGLLAASYDVLHSFKHKLTDNRGPASGTPRRTHINGKSTRSRAKRVPSSMIGAFEAQGPRTYCRISAFSAREGEKYRSLFSLFTAIGALFAQHVPDRFATQMDYVQHTQPEWVIPGTPFTTITINNSFPTGTHTDKGDLEDGFSTLAVLRRGQYTGGWLCFPEYRVGVDMQHGDLLLMDAHAWHGNTPLALESDDAERISVVSYFRGSLTKCGTAGEEAEKQLAAAERRSGLSKLDR